jgi:thioredoxin 1
MENKSNSSVIIGSVIAAIVLIGGISLFAMNNKPAVDTTKNDAMTKVSEVMQKDGATMAKDAMTKEGDKMMSKSSEVMTKTDSMVKDAMMNKSSMTPEAMEKMMKDDAMMKDQMAKMTPEEKERMMKQDAMMKTDAMAKDAMMKKDDTMAMTKTGYSSYSPEAIAKNADGTNVIFFHAPWCPTCKAAEADINSNIASLPAKFNILKVDYDTSTALKQKYGVTSQSTFVKVDKDGNKLSMGNGFTKLADIVAFGQK